MTPVRPLLTASLALALLATPPALAAPAPAPTAVDHHAETPGDDALDDAALADALLALVTAHPQLVRVQNLAMSRGGREVPVVIVGSAGEPLVDRRGLLVVAGVDGRRQADTRLAVDMLGELLGGDDPAGALGEHVLIVVPRLNPDGAAAARGEDGPAREQIGNGRPDDADRDGRVDEDGPDDLDGDGLITVMRIADGAGEWVIDEHDPRAMRKARRGEGERGTHRLEVEGVDDDGDGASGEDGGQGVRLDHNFPHGWPEHAATSGDFALSEPATAALARLIHEHPGLLAVLELGAEDTLVGLPRSAKGDSGRFMREPLDGVHGDDVSSLEQWQRLFDEADAKELAAKADSLAGGGLLAWAYHQRGRWPLGVRAWSVPETLEDADKRVKAAQPEEEPEESDDSEGSPSVTLPDGRVITEDTPGVIAITRDADGTPIIREEVVTTVTEVVDTRAVAPDVIEDILPPEPPPEEPELIEEVVEEDDADGDDDESDDDDDDDEPKPTSDKDSPVPAAVLRWLDGVHDGAGIVPWTAVEHDEYDDVEVGGLAPNVLVDPPYADVADLAGPLARFVLDGLAAYPSLAIEDVAMTRHGGGVYTLELALVNTGVLPTAPRLAADTRTQRPVRVKLVLPEGVTRVNGPEQVLVDRLEGGGGRRELRWVLAGAGSGVRVSVSADCDVAADVLEEIILP